MSAAIVNIVIGLVTSVVSGSLVWLWQFVKKTRIWRSRAAFFGLHPGDTCLIVMNHKWNAPGSTHQNDVHAMIDLATVATELGAKISVISCDDIRGGNADRTEFCIGGPGSNPRTTAHLASYVPGVRVVSGETRESMAFIAGGQRFSYQQHQQEYAIVAKFIPSAATRPVILISGQTAITNRAAAHLLKCDYRQLMKAVASADRFCLVLRITASSVYGHEMVEVARDVSDVAFVPHKSPIGTAGDTAHA